MTAAGAARSWPTIWTVGRWALLIMSIVVVTIALPYPDLLRGIIEGRAPKKAAAAATPTEEFRKAVDYRLDLSKTLFQATLIVLGALWSILLKKKEDRIVIFHDALAVAMFCCANVVLFSAMYEHTQYVWEMSDIMARSAITTRVPDITSPYVSEPLLSQLIRLFFALLVSAFTFLNAKWA